VGALAGFLVIALDLPTLVSFWSDRAFAVPTGAALGALLWRTRLRPLLSGATALLGLTWLLVAYTPLARGLAAGLVRADPVAPADAVLVLSSRLQHDGQLTPEAESRLLRGVELLAEGRAPRLVITEQKPPAVPYAPAARALLRRFGMEHEVVAVGPVANTHDEAVAMARLAGERGLARVLVVSSATHTARACAAVERTGLAVVCVPAPETRFDLETQDRPLDRLELFGRVLHERVGSWVYRRRGWIGPAGAPGPAPPR
jgi:uncharacterized SAM-binding protein YcdF (DUF218 family)